MTARIAPLRTSDLDDDTRELLALVGDRGARSNVFRTLARHKSLLRRFIPYGGKLVNGTLPARTRELVVLRVAARAGCGYEWASHVDIALDAGVTVEEIRGLRDDPDLTRWTDLDRLVLRSVDALFDTSSLSDGTWTALARHLDETQLLELPLLVGHFVAVAYFLNAIRVENDGPADELRRLAG
jgi:AhpD family alkylhydroperoxidase